MAHKQAGKGWPDLRMCLFIRRSGNKSGKGGYGQDVVGHGVSAARLWHDSCMHYLGLVRTGAVLAAAEAGWISRTASRSLGPAGCRASAGRQRRQTVEKTRFVI